MIDETILGGIEEGREDSIGIAKAMLEVKNVSQAELVQLWNAAIEGTLKGKKASYWFGFSDLSDRTKDPETLGIYLDLVHLAVDVSYLRDLRGLCKKDEDKEGIDNLIENTFQPVIRTGAAIVHAQAGLIGAKGFDTDRFLKLAKRCLLKAVGQGTDETRLFAVEALRNFSGKQHEVKERLVGLARITNDAKLMGAIMESLEQIRPYEEAEVARSDLRMILEANDDIGPTKLYSEMVFSAIENVYTLMGQPLLNDELKVAVMQLKNCGIGSKDKAEGLMLDDITVQLIRKNVENALVYALRSDEEGIRADAVEGLSQLGGSRVEAILQRISEREARDDGMSATGKAARQVLLNLHRKEKPNLPPPLPPAALREKRKAQRALVR
jgi:hypothetical protein